jgi:tetratricopeptide (TPR) repeat protein
MDERRENRDRSQTVLRSAWANAWNATFSLQSTEIMTQSRIEKIHAMLQDDPEDAFLRYTLAMEYRKQDDNDKSLELLTQLANHEEPRYVAAFFMAAQQLVELERMEEARTFLREGIEEARRQGNSHAAAEMSELLSEIGK